MRTRLLVAFLTIIPLAGMLVYYVPPPRPKPLAMNSLRAARRDLLKTRVKQSALAYQAGDFRTGAAIAQRGYLDARAAGELRIAARFLGNLGGCRFALHQFREALAAYTQARSLAEAAGDRAIAGKLDINICSLYSQLRQLDAAVESARRAMTRLSGDDRVQQLPSWLILLAGLRADQGRMPEAIALYRQSIVAAEGAGGPETIAMAWNDLGYEYLEHRKLPLAERALLEGYRIRKLNHLRSIESSYRNLGMLRLEQGNTEAASGLLDEAVARSRQPGGLRPAWEVYSARGRVRVAQHRLTDALEDLRVATRWARIWRRNALPNDATRVSTENFIQKVHESLVDAGNQLYFKTRSPALARETFESAESNRAASLRALLAEPPDWRRKLPPEYWETLQKLESAEVALWRATPPSSGELPAAERLRQLQGALNEWESRAGSNTDVELPDLLERTRQKLRPDAAFLAFHLASPNSYLWAVSNERFALYRLPSAADISVQVDRFTRDIRQRNSDGQASGGRLFRMLFGQVDPAFLTKPRWLLALDAQLFELPFAALVERRGRRGPVFLAELHSVQTVSGAGMLLDTTRESTMSGPFLAIADPIYNTADPRWTGTRPGSFRGFFTAGAAEAKTGGDFQLARLAGSAREAAGCATAWGGTRPPILLEGVRASRQNLIAQLNKGPSVVHFATHVVTSLAGTRSGLIVLSLGADGRQQLVNPLEIATWNLSGALVSLSGCGAGAANSLPATGLMGLTRACQAAGARAVVASRWTTPDDSGELFLSFYRHLRTSPMDGPARALQLAQIDMLRSRTWRSHPQYWSAYFVTGNQQ